MNIFFQCMLFYANYKKCNFDGEKKHKMDKAAPASYHKQICVWFCQKSQCTYVSAAKLHLDYRKKTLFFQIFA